MSVTSRGAGTGDAIVTSRRARRDSEGGSIMDAGSEGTVPRTDVGCRGLGDQDSQQLKPADQGGEISGAGTQVAIRWLGWPEPSSPRGPGT